MTTNEQTIFYLRLHAEIAARTAAAILRGRKMHYDFPPSETTNRKCYIIVDCDKWPIAGNDSFPPESAR